MPTSKVHQRTLPAQDYSLKSLKWYCRAANVASIFYLVMYWLFVFVALSILGVDVAARNDWGDIPERYDLPIFHTWFQTLALVAVLVLVGLVARDAHIKRGVEADESKAAYDLLVVLYAANPTEETPIHPTLLGTDKR